jgi:hypothetical protein
VLPNQALAAYVLSFMLAQYSVQNHRCTGASDAETLEHYRAIAADIADASLDPDEPPVFRTDKTGDGRVKTALLLASIARWESQYRQDVDELRVRGDGGAALCILQIHPFEGEVIEDRASCLRAGLRHLRASYRACHSLSGYTVGRCVAGEVEAERRLRPAERWLRDNPYKSSATSSKP